MKRIIQVFKAPDQWVNSPPGLGDFIRGTCHLHEFLSSKNIDFSIDISQSDFHNHIFQDAQLFSINDSEDIVNATEYFTHHNLLINDINQFLNSSETSLFVSTNFGNWNRVNLPLLTKETMKMLYVFNDSVSFDVSSNIPVNEYEVLSIRCGDKFYGKPEFSPEDSLLSIIFNIIENIILPNLKSPLVITSDSFHVKNHLSEKYGFLMLPHQSEHGAFNSSCYPVCMDMHLLKNSKYIYHINVWANWWSGFSHFTSQIFSIPSLNFRAPEFQTEQVL